MAASRSTGTWLAVLAGVMVVVVGWAFFALALTTDVFSGDRNDDRAIVVSAPSTGDGPAVATIDIAALDAHLAAVDERIAALEDAQANAPAVVSPDTDSPPISIDGVALDAHLAAVDERIASADERMASLDSRIAAVDQRIAALEDAVESAGQMSPTQGIPPHDHVTSPVSTFPHVWTRTGNTLPEEFLHVRLAEGLWHFEFEAACIGDLSSCPRPGERSPVLLVRDLVEYPFDYPDQFESGTEWCEDFEATREIDWRLWMANVRGVTWSLTIDEGECPSPGE